MCQIQMAASESHEANTAYYDKFHFYLKHQLLCYDINLLFKCVATAVYIIMQANNILKVQA